MPAELYTVMVFIGLFLLLVVTPTLYILRSHERLWEWIGRESNT